MTKERKGKVPYLPSVTGFSSKLVFNLDMNFTLFIILTGPPTGTCRDLNQRPLSLEENVLLPELMRPDMLYEQQTIL